MTTGKAFHDELWRFPCKLNVKAMGLAEYDLEALIVNIANTHCSEIYPDSITSKESRNGKYRSITITVQLASKHEGEQLYLALGAREEIKWTL